MSATAFHADEMVVTTDQSRERFQPTSRKRAAQSALPNPEQRAPATVADVDQALIEMAGQMETWAATAHVPRAAWNELKLIFNQERSRWFGIVWKAFDERSILVPGSPAYSRALAYNAWVCMGRFWMEYAPLPHVPIYRVLFESLRAAGAPLPVQYTTACGIRRRIERRVRAALDESSKMSHGRWLYWIRNYAPIAAAELRLGSPEEQRARAAERRLGPRKDRGRGDRHH